MALKKPSNAKDLPRKKRGGARPTAPRQQVQEETSGIEGQIVRISDLRKRADDLKAVIDQEQAELLAAMEESGLNSAQTTDPATGDVVQATVVKGEIVTTDDTKLKKRVGATVWNKITTRTLDKGLLDSAIKAGTVSDVDLAASSTVRQRKPFIKITRK
ncbi:hypothetical protein SEA_KABOCHA_82 [Gordonia phage Kabocha]|uniref:Uncharacterized protein n=1 Tax=Gordonia phage Chidiebere TaxID=2656530 RepID=A0A649VL35_9CAUD|nr:hypothetical protein PQD14_gp081 [Gordonia phage Chidiebere]QGJ92971.1 hypothetical protein PBI_CHIDIEBERE_81 [Gordonia phage Chidiebere]WAA19868.1 hypothetical protein SEA_KABOCHA_82 [Gordonia phage Kabocha]WAA20057.1 hypothetical protein SEA_HANEM_80 [Gordonia phage Hanem]WNM67100.1 host nuclease inhibitor [Gordonia Phage Schomber]